VNDVGPILCALRSLGFEAVGYYGEMDVRAKSESYTKWRSGTAQLMVATKAFGMGINRKDVRHIIRNGIPESISSWAQELGRGGRDGLPATATISPERHERLRHTESSNAFLLRDHEGEPQQTRGQLRDILRTTQPVQRRDSGKRRLFKWLMTVLFTNMNL